MKSGQENGPQMGKTLDRNFTHKKKSKHTKVSISPWTIFLFSVFWPHCCWRVGPSQGSPVPTDSVNNSPVAPFKYKPTNPEPTPTTSPGSLSTCPNHLTRYQTTRDSPFAPEPAEIILTSQSEACVSCPACSFPRKAQQRLLPSCSFYLCLLTNLGAFLCGHLRHDVPFPLVYCE